MPQLQTQVKPLNSADQLSYNINIFFYIRFFFGYYHEFQVSKPVRWLAKCYCCLISIGVTVWAQVLHKELYLDVSIHITLCEYLFYILFSFLKSNKYLLRYYKKTPLVDANTFNYRPIRIFIPVYLCSVFALKIISMITSILHVRILDLYTITMTLLNNTVWICLFMGRLPVFFVFALLYTRVRLMRQVLQSHNFDCRMHGKHHPRRYIQMYEAIMNGLEESDGPVKTQLFVYIVAVSFGMIYWVLDRFYEMKSNGVDNISETVWYVLDVILITLPIFLSAALADLVSLEMHQILGIVVERRITSKNERDRAEIQKLYQLLKSSPFKYSLWRVVPLNVRCLLSFVSFCVTTVIAIIQIKTWVT